MGRPATLAGMVLIVRVNVKAFATVKGDKLKDLAASIEALADRRVMVGFPQETTERSDDDGPTNAELAYIHNFGAPEAHIPQREFMAPGIKSVQDELIDMLKDMALATLQTDIPILRGSSTPVLDRWLNRIGLKVQNAIKATIRAGLSPPLAPATVEARIARRKSKAWRAKRRSLVAANVAAGKAPGEGIFTPLIDTAAMINSCTYVIRIPSTNRTLAIGPTPGRKG